jgi:DNA-directed RNA polymerase subunit F
MRTGQFTRASHEYGAALSVVKPRNNDPGDITPPENLDWRDTFTKEQWEQLTEDSEQILDILRRY